MIEGRIAKETKGAREGVLVSHASPGKLMLVTVCLTRLALLLFKRHVHCLRMDVDQGNCCSSSSTTASLAATRVVPLSTAVMQSRASVLQQNTADPQLLLHTQARSVRAAVVGERRCTLTLSLVILSNKRSLTGDEAEQGCQVKHSTT